MISYSAIRFGNIFKLSSSTPRDQFITLDASRGQVLLDDEHGILRLSMRLMTSSCIRGAWLCFHPSMLTKVSKKFTTLSEAV